MDLFTLPNVTKCGVLRPMKIKKGVYQHFKGQEYEVIDVVTHSETNERLVLYRPLYGDRALWVRPYDNFFSKVVKEGLEVARFQFVSSA